MIHAAIPSAIALAAWGAVSFGAVYPWGYLTLAIGSAALCVALLADREVRARASQHPLLVPFAVVLGAMALQLVPLPPALLHWLSPSAPALLGQYEIGYFAGSTFHPLSIQPAATVIALTLCFVLAQLLVVMTSTLERVGARRLAAGLVVLGFVVALVAIVQRPLFAGRIYGFWQPEQGGRAFGPFVNPNHFAGWMAMALSLTLGVVCGQIAGAMPRRARSWRDYAAWASSREASGLMLAMTAALVMGLSLVLSLSRSGIVCFLLAALAAGLVVFRRQRGARRVLAVSFLAALVAGSFVWAGPSTVAREFGETGRAEDAAPLASAVATRLGPWSDAVFTARAFPAAGTGVNTYGAAMIFLQRYDLESHYDAAHNDYLQLLAEGGVLVALPALWAGVVLVRTIRRRFAHDGMETYWIRAGAVTGLAAIALQELVDFSLQMPGNAMLFLLLCAIALHRAPARPPRLT